MAVRSWSSACAVVALAAALGGLGCKGDDDGQDGVIAGNGANLQPKNGPAGSDMMIHSSSPGLEPPVTGPTDMMQSPQMTAGMGTSGSGSFGNPSGAAGGAGGMSMSGTPGTTPGAAAGAGGNNAAGTPASEDPGARDGGTGDGGQDVCADAPECGLDTPCADSSLHCIALDMCSHPICISPEAACMAECDQTECALLESYPEQIACN